jgi:hypothetical protein
MNRPSKKDIKAALEKLKETNSSGTVTPESQSGKLAPKKSSQRIRKQGV